MIAPEVRGLLSALRHWHTVTEGYYASRPPQSIEWWGDRVVEAEDAVTEAFRRAVRAVHAEGD